MVKSTIDQKEIKDLYWIILGSDEMFTLWWDVCESYLACKLPDGAGKTEKARKPEAINLSSFNCFKGNISKANIMEILKMVKAEKALLKKNKESDSDIPKMEDIAKSLKQQNLLQKEIMRFFEDNYWENFPMPLTWEDLTAKIADLGSPAFHRAELNGCWSIASPIDYEIKLRYSRISNGFCSIAGGYS
jgi:hypothetical protein